MRGVGCGVESDGRTRTALAVGLRGCIRTWVVGGGARSAGVVIQKIFRDFFVETSGCGFAGGGA
jgi:hypothetical protein